MPNDGYFDSKRDRAVIEAGGFFCYACLVGKPTTEASPDPRYCHECYELRQKESGDSEKKSSEDFWEEGGAVFVTGGIRWAIDKATGRTISLGKTIKDKDGKPINKELPPLPAPAILKAIEGGFEMKVGSYEVEADELNYVIFRKTPKGRKPYGYFSTLSHALEELITLGLRDTELKDLQTVNTKFTELQNFVSKLANGITPKALQTAQNGEKGNKSDIPHNKPNKGLGADEKQRFDGM